MKVINIHYGKYKFFKLYMEWELNNKSIFVFINSRLFNLINVSKWKTYSKIKLLLLNYIAGYKDYGI